MVYWRTCTQYCYFFFHFIFLVYLKLLRLLCAKCICELLSATIKVFIKIIEKVWGIFQVICFFWSWFFVPHVIRKFSSLASTKSKLEVNYHQKTWAWFSFNPYLANVPISCLLKIPENLWFSYVFRGFKMRTLARNGLIYKKDPEKLSLTQIRTYSRVSRIKNR